ncbi:hypothetical protein RU07_10450 [Agrobacterium tumefaciens]|uniref:Uncharacterized protein n=1 Tax=Agrobacterium tumefaciens TaxID=358 RepID=A0A0D0KX51_AGRTU|nr:hypothetical protein RU07_10450 [Agrobacterium tumefaciens]
MGSRSGDDINISPRYKVEHWKALTLDTNNPVENDWNIAVDILDDRITERFLKPAQYLINAPFEGSQPTFGFAILALDFVVIETIQGFREGKIKHNNGVSPLLFKKFCADWEPFIQTVDDPLKIEDAAGNLYSQGRCAIHHKGSTESLIVGITGEMITFNKDGSIHINRTVFHERLVDEFKRYLAQLRDPTSNDFRKNFQKKMNSICGMAG